MQKAQVSGAQERTLTGSGNVGVEGAPCLFGFLPVSSGPAGAGSPDFSDFIIRAWRQGFRELIECFAADRLGAEGRDLPVAQIKRCLLFSRELADAEIIAKIRADADGSPSARNCLQPAIGALQKGKRRHHRRWIAAIHWKENAADKSHIVIRRQPCHHMAGVFKPLLAVLYEPFQIVQKIAVRDHHPFRRRGGTGCVLQEGERIGSKQWFFPLLRQGSRDGIGRNPFQVLQVWHMCKVTLQVREEIAGCKHDGGLRVLNNGLDARHHACRSRWIGRYGDCSSIETTKKGADVSRTRRVQQEYRFSCSALLL